MSGKKNHASLSQARHNANVCQLLQTKKHWDWVITTAFYSAIHFTRYRIFPCKIEVDGKLVTCKNFEMYSRKQSKDSFQVRGRKHKQMSNLISDKLGQVSSNYDRLKDTSWSARYNAYSISKAQAETAIKDLAAIRNVCEPSSKKK